MARHAGPGRLDWIGLRPARRDPMIEVSRARIDADGLQGDRHPSAGKRAVTLVQAEHLPVISALARAEATFPLLRRNLAVSGINLAALKGRIICIGTARLRLTGPCAPCSRMEEVLGQGGYTAVRHHGGWCAEVVAPGDIAIGDTVLPEPDNADH